MYLPLYIHFIIFCLYVNLFDVQNKQQQDKKIIPYANSVVIYYIYENCIVG